MQRDWVIDAGQHPRQPQTWREVAQCVNRHLMMQRDIQAAAPRGDRIHAMDEAHESIAGPPLADQEQGAQVLICSEIGSEGRNFQFSHHLVLFDLPLNPDLLEQRIGRLDRIGQRHTVDIHVPFYRDSAQQVLLYWYHQGIFHEILLNGQMLRSLV